MSICVKRNIQGLKVSGSSGWVSNEFPGPKGFNSYEVDLPEIGGKKKVVKHQDILLRSFVFFPFGQRESTVTKVEERSLRNPASNLGFRILPKP